MSVYDRWHLSHPQPGDEPCREHSRGRTQLFPTGDHGKGRRWQVRYHDADGKPKRRNFDKRDGDDPEKHAAAFDAKMRAELDAGTYIDPSAGKITLTEYAKRWRAGLTSDASTLASIDSKLRVHVYGKPIGDIPMRVLSRRPSAVQQWIAGMTADGMEPSSIKVICGLVSSIFVAAIDDEAVTKNPFRSRSVRPPEPVKRRIMPWTPSEVEAAAQAVSARYRAMVYMCAGCGHRQGEAFAVAEDDIDVQGLEICIRRQVRLVAGKLCFYLPKRGKERAVPLLQDVADILQAHMLDFPPAEVTLPWRTPDSGRTHTAKLLFFTPELGALNRDLFNQDEWRPARGAAGMAATRENGMHGLRHTAASWWLAAGMDINEVALFLGHEDASFTLRTYTHLMPNAADRAARARAAMGQFFSKIDSGSALYVPAEWTEDS